VRGSTWAPGLKYETRLMRVRFLILVLFAAGCGPTSPILGSWRYEVETLVQSPSGTTTKKVMFTLDFSSTASPDLVTWKLGGGCNVPLGLVGSVATLGPDPQLCGLSAGAQLPLLAETGTTVKAGDQVGVRIARFEVLADGRLGTQFEYKVYTDLKDDRVGPVVSVTSTATTHGTHVK
jgi:hypothetical protein